MKTTKRTLTVLLAVLMIFGLLVPGALAAEDASITPLSGVSPPAQIRHIFPDPELAMGIAAVLDDLLLTSVDVYTVVSQTDLDEIEVISHGPLFNRGIQNLDGMQYLSNLESLSLFDNDITDISPLAGLVNLEMLYITDNQIIDISPLTGLVNLRVLWADHNQITDISPLANLTNLGFLNLNDNEISDFQPLVGFANLDMDLSAMNQQITLSPIALADPLTVANNVFLPDGTRVTPTGGISATPYDTVTWTGLTSADTQVSFTFNETSTFGFRPTTFSGTVTQPLTFTPVDVTGVAITPAGDFQLNTNATRQLTATVAPTTATNQAVTWSSSDTAIATVTAGGLVRGIAPGTATITVTTVCGGYTYDVIVTVVTAPPWQPPNNGGGSPPPPQPDPDPEYRFLDVNSDNWFYDAVMFVYEQGIMQGTSTTVFSPDATLSRGMVATILHRLEGEPVSTASHSFGDVAPGTWYANAVAWAFENGIVQGVSATSFAPSAPITREQLATMLHRYAEFAGVNISVSAGANLDHFADAYRVSSWAEDAKLWANYNDLITGRTTTTIVPGGTANRAEAATILMRFIQNF